MRRSGFSPANGRYSWAFARQAFTLLGVAPFRAGELVRLHLCESAAGQNPRAQRFRRYANGLARLLSLRVGIPAGLRQSRAMPPFTRQHRGSATTASHNKSANTDPQQQEAASPQMLWSGYLQR